MPRRLALREPLCLATPPRLATPPCQTLSLSNLIIASTYSVVAVGAVVFMRLIQDVDALQQPTVCNGPGDDADALRVPLLRQRTCSLHKASAAARLWCSRPTVLLLAPIQITFGVCAALLGQVTLLTVTLLTAAPLDTAILTTAVLNMGLYWLRPQSL